MARIRNPLLAAKVQAEDAYGCVSELTHSPTILYPMTPVQFARSLRKLDEAAKAIRDLRRAMDRARVAA